MAAVSKLSLAVGVGASITAFVTQPAFRAFLEKWTAYNAPGGAWRIVAILLALINLKNLPLVWHLRFFRAFGYQLYLQPTPIPPNALFQPIVTSTHTSLLETDYNLHKSNSTYFADMDISRTHLFTAIIRNGIQKHSRLYGKKRGIEAIGAADGTRGKHMIALGGISCLFKKEILPYTKFEMWTRILTWDKKWFYLVTHLVRPGVAKPKGWTLQPWRRVNTEQEKVDKEKLKGAVYASALAKYVIKRGRITVPPEQALIDADMIPAKPEGWEYKGGEIAGDLEGLLPTEQGDEWNWDVIEAERQRGLRFAEGFAELDGLHEIFDGGEKGALGEYADFLFR